MTSIRLTVFLLLILAVVAVVGTVAFPGIYYQAWFLAPLGLLALNLLACLVEGLPQAVKKVARPFTGEKALSLPERGRFVWPPDAEAATMAQVALRRELAKFGINPMRVRTLSYGEDRPVDPGHDESAWSRNRRGEFILLHPKSGA